MHINNVIANTNNVYVYYNLLIFFVADILLTKIYLKFLLAIKTAIIVNNNLDYYRYINNSSYFCKFCYDIIVKKKYQNLDLLTILTFYLVENTLTFLII